MLLGFLGTERDPKCHTRSGQSCSWRPAQPQQLLWGMQEQWMCNMILPPAWPGSCQCASWGLQSVHRWFKVWQLVIELLISFFNPIPWTSTVLHNSLIFVKSSSPATSECLIRSFLKFQLFNRQNTWITLILKVNWAKIALWLLPLCCR